MAMMAMKLWHWPPKLVMAQGRQQYVPLMALTVLIKYAMPFTVQLATTTLGQWANFAML